MLFWLLIFCFFPLIFADCPGNGIEWQSKCYYFIANSSSFVTAELDCISRGGHLASVHDGFTNAFIGQEGLQQFHDSTTSDIWIGGTTYINPGNWSWTDGSDFTFTHLNNSTTMPSESCIGLSLSNGMWNAVDSFKEKPYVCAMNNTQNPTTLLPVTTTTTTTPATTTTAIKPSCQSNWYYFNTTYSCYFLTPAMDWSAAEEYCQAFGGHLVSIHSQAENNFINNFAYATWIGFFSTDNKATWKWSDGSVLDYVNWGPNDPGEHNNLCANFGRTYFFNNFACSEAHLGICKKSAYSH